MSGFELVGLFLLTVALGAVITLAVIALRAVEAQARQTAAQAEKIRDQAAELENLKKQLDRRAHTYSTAAGLEDAIAIDLDLALNAARTLQYIETRSGQLRDVLAILRQSPHSYDANRPAGRRPEV